MNYHQFDTQDSDAYCESRNIHDVLNNHATQNSSVDTSEHFFGPRARYGCVKNTDLEHNLFTDQYNLSKYKSFCDKDKKCAEKQYSDCLGYECNRNHPHDFMYPLDEYNTYHNYLVCEQTKSKDEYNTFSQACCPKNIQIFNNLTRRHLGVPQNNKPSQTLIMDDQAIPIVTMKRCYLDRLTKHE